MNFKDHSNYGLVSASLVSVSTFYLTSNNIISLACGVLTYLFSLFPDLDTQSTPSRYAAMIGVATALFLLLAGKQVESAIIGISYMAIKTQKHRGYTHKYVIPLALSLVGVYFLPSFGIFFLAIAVGFLTHYFCDSLNPLLKKNWI